MSRHEDVGGGAVKVVSLVIVALVILGIFGGFVNGCVYQGASSMGLGDLFNNPDHVEPVEESAQRLPPR